MEIGCGSCSSALLLLRVLCLVVLDRVGVLGDVAPQRVHALGDDVDFEVRPGHRGLHAGSGLLVLLLVLLRDKLLGDGLLEGELLRDRLLDQLLADGLRDKLLDEGLLEFRDGLLLGRSRLRHGLLLRRGLVGHQASISSGWGFCATCGCSGPAYTLSFVSCLRARRLRGIIPFTAILMISSGRRASISSKLRERRPPG